MKVWWRAVAATALVIGFYAVAVALVAGVTVLMVWAGSVHEQMPLAAIAAAVMAFAALTIAASVRALRRRTFPPAVELGERDAPELWQLVRAVASRVGTEAPQHVRLTAAANAWVFEDARFGGLRPGQRYLDIGVAVLMGLRTAEIEAVLAHEMGHYSNRDTRLGGLVYRGRDVIMDVAEGAAWPPLRVVLQGYLGLYWAVSAAVLRRQERFADHIAAEVAGPAALVAALRRLPAIERDWASYLDDRVALPHGYGYAPDNICGDFHCFLLALDTARPDPAPPTESELWDTHPPLAERITMLTAMTSTPAPDTGPAMSLVPDVRDYGPALDDISFPVRGRIRLPFAEYAVRVARLRAAEREQLLYQVAQRSDLLQVLDLLAAGGAEMLAARIAHAQGPHADPDTTVHLLTVHVEAALSMIATRAGLAQWRDSWTGGVHLIDGAGQRFRFTEDLDCAGLAAAVCTGSVAHLGALRARLAGFADSPPDDPAATSSVLHGAAVAVTTNGRYCDLLILDSGLLVLNGNREDDATLRLEEYARRFEITRKPPEHGWTVNYTDVRAARLLHRTRADLRLTLRDGTSLLIEETGDTAFLATQREDPRQLLRRIADVIPQDGLAPPTAGGLTSRVPPTRLSLPEAGSEVLVRSRNKIVLGLMLLASAPLLLALALSVDGSTTSLYAGAVTGAVTGPILLVWGRLERTRGRGRGTGFIICGAVLIAGFTFLAVLTWPVRLLWFFAGYGAVLVALGVARRRGRWAAREGNALKVAAGVPATLALGGTVDQLADGDQPGMVFFLIPAVLLYLAGAALPHARTADKATQYGVMGILLLVAPPFGVLFSAVSIYQARKVGTRPTLGFVGIGVTLLLCSAMTVFGLAAG